MTRTLAPSRVLAVLAVVASAGAPPAAAQQHPNHVEGFQPERLYQLGDLDDINLFNGNATIQIPIGGTYGTGGGFSYQIVLTYSGNIWEYESIRDSEDGHDKLRAVPRQASNAGVGWQVSLGGLDAPGGYRSPDGAVHPLLDSLHPGGSTTSGYRYTQNGSYLREDATVSPKVLEFPDGTRRSFTAGGQLLRLYDRFDNSLTITYVPSGVTGIDHWRLDDSQGRRHWVYFKEAPALAGRYRRGVVDRVELEAFGGKTATYTFSYTSLQVTRGLTDSSLPCEDGPTTETVPLLTSIEYSSSNEPTWTRFTFAYDPGPYHVSCLQGGSLAQTDSRSGHLVRMDLPTGGAVELDWEYYLFPQQSEQVAPFYIVPPPFPGPIKPFTTSAGVIERRTLKPGGTLDGRWTYGHALTPDDSGFVREKTTTVTDPLGNETRHYFSVYACQPDIQGCPDQDPDPDGWSRYDYGLPFTRFATDGTGARFLSSEIKQGTTPTNQQVQRRHYVRYESSGLGANQRVASERTVYVDDGSRFADVDRSDFDGLGHYRRARTNGNFPAGNVRETFTQFNPGSCAACTPSTGSPWVLGTFTLQQVTEGGATARTEACFEAATGFLRRTRTLASGTTRGTTDLVTRSTGDASGNVTAEESFGGDTQALGTGGLCGLALPSPTYRIDHTYQDGSLKTSQYQGQTFKTADFDIDPSTGRVMTSRDVSGLATTFEYDGLGRPAWVKPAQESWTQFVYNVPSGTTPAKVFIHRRPNGGGTPLAQEEVHFDPFGRVAVERRKLADGTFSSRTTTYYPQGWLKSRSEWGTAASTQYLNPDAFGRPATIRPPEGSAHDVTLSYDGVRQVERTVKVGTGWNGSAVTEAASTTTEIYDRQGRLSQVQEPANPDGSDATTTYLYDVGGRLKEVTQTGKSLAGTSFTQSRKFTFDHRGFLLSEKHPEKGASGNGTVTYSDYDARGHAGQVVDGDHTLRFTYDGAERLTEVEESLGSNTWRPLRTLTYATTNALPNRRLGKLEVARAYNHVVLGGTPHTVEVSETYTYAGKQGRASKRDTVTEVTSPFTGVLGSFTQSWTWNDLGDAASITYPRCTHAGCGATTIRTVSPAYTHGFLTAVPGYTSATAPNGRPITYHANGQVHQILRANGTTDTYTKDPQNQPRPRRIEARVTSGGSLRWDSGEHAFDGAGNLTRAGDGYFLYDPVSRVTDGQVEIPGEGCGEELLLASGTDNTTKTYQSCGTVRAKGSYGVGSTGHVTFRAGSRVVLGDGFSVATGGRLTAEVDPSLDPGGGSTLATFDHAYDGFGNLQSLTANGAQRNTPTGAATNRLQGFHVGYDAAGNLTNWSGATYEYNALNQTWRTANGAEDWTHFYTADGERILSYSPAGPFSRFTVRDLDGKVLTELNVDNAVSTAMTLQRDYVYRGAQLLAAHTADASPKDLVHFHLDHLGTPRAITDRNNALLASHVYYPYGEEASSPTQDVERMKFTGHERDLGDPSSPADDLDYMHARFYNPQTGRLLSVDPILGNARQPQSWNRYSYTLGNPLKYRDPSGRYVVNCSPGDDMQCKEDAAAFEEARQENLESDDQAVRNAALAYGDPGEENGVTVAFGETRDETGSTAVYAQGGEGGSWSMVAVVTVESGLRGTALLGTVAHEGQHLIDANAFVDTFSSLSADPWVRYDSSKNLTRYENELNAFRLTHSVYSSAGERFSTGCRGCVLGAGIKTAAEVNLAITKILADPRGAYRVTPENPGGRQFRDWQ